LQAQTTEITGDGSKAKGIEFKDRISGEERQVALASTLAVGDAVTTQFNQIMIAAGGRKRRCRPSIT